MKQILRQHHISFTHAWEGIKWAFSTQPNFKIHIFLSVSALLAAFYLKVTTGETILLVFTIIFGLGMEMVNTSLESMTDLITNEYKKEAKIAKDVAAGMMLMTAVGAILIAGLIFIPRIILLFN